MNNVFRKITMIEYLTKLTIVYHNHSIAYIEIMYSILIVCCVVLKRIGIRIICWLFENMGLRSFGIKHTKCHNYDGTVLVSLISYPFINLVLSLSKNNTP